MKRVKVADPNKPKMIAFFRANGLPEVADDGTVEVSNEILARCPESDAFVRAELEKLR